MRALPCVHGNGSHKGQYAADNGDDCCIVLWAKR